MTQEQKFRREFSGDPERLEKMKEFIQSYWVKFHRSPNVREVRIALGGLSTSVISYYRDRLEHDGWLEVVAKPRAVCSFVPTEIFADRPVFPIQTQTAQDELDNLSDKLATNYARMAGKKSGYIYGLDLGKGDDKTIFQADADRVFNGKVQVGSEMIPAVANDDVAHMPMIHREKE